MSVISQYHIPEVLEQVQATLYLFIPFPAGVLYKENATHKAKIYIYILKIKIKIKKGEKSEEKCFVNSQEFSTHYYMNI